VIFAGEGGTDQTWRTAAVAQSPPQEGAHAGRGQREKKGKARANRKRSPGAVWSIYISKGEVEIGPGPEQAGMLLSFWLSRPTLASESDSFRLFLNAGPL
jgi:hypothetical protein